MTHDLYFSSQAEADQYTVERQISSYRARFRDIPGRKARLMDMERRRVALSAPIYKLPDDILAEIFKTGALNDGLVDLGYSLNVSAVVSRWRRVALETPPLWTSFTITLPLSTRKQGYLEFARRAGALPLQVELRMAEEIEEDQVREEQMIETCDSLWLRCSAVRIEGALGLGFSLPARFSGSRIAPAPSLRHLRLAWSHLRTSEHFLGLLAASRHLSDLVIEEVMIEDLTPPPTPIEFPDLRTLLINGFWVGDAQQSDMLMTYLNAPRLQNLYLFNIHGAFRDACYGSSSVTLLEIRAPTEAPTVEDVLALIGGFPSLEVLKLELAFLDKAKTAPACISLPPISHLDFGGTVGIDTLACDMATRIVQDHGKGCLKSVKAATFASFSNTSRTFIHNLAPDVELSPS